MLSVYLLCLVPHSSLPPCSFTSCPHGSLFLGLCLLSVPFLSSVLQSVYQSLYSVLSVKRTGVHSVFQQTRLTQTQLLLLDSFTCFFKIFPHSRQILISSEVCLVSPAWICHPPSASSRILGTILDSSLLLTHSPHWLERATIPP